MEKLTSKITINISSQHKEALQKMAFAKGLKLIPYCRMKLIEVLKDGG